VAQACFCVVNNRASPQILHLFNLSQAFFLQFQTIGCDCNHLVVNNNIGISVHYQRCKFRAITFRVNFDFPHDDVLIASLLVQFSDARWAPAQSEFEFVEFICDIFC